jgi:hypothetical protein
VIQAFIATEANYMFQQMATHNEVKKTKWNQAAGTAAVTLAWRSVSI